MQFNRTASVVIGPKGQTGVEISGLRIVFDIKKTASTAQNALTLKIYNLSETTRSFIDDDDNQVIVRAGYENEDGEENIFIGTVTNVTTKYEGADVVTTIESGDGHDVLKDAKLFESFKPGTTAEQVVKALSDSFGVAVKEISADLKEAFANGFSVSGSAKKSMDVVAAKIGAEWSIQDGELIVVKEGKPNADDVILLTPETGLIGSPEKTKDTQGLSGLNVKSLLSPKIIPTGRVKVKSRDIDGVFRIESVQHQGDTHGDSWFTVTELNYRS